MAANYRYLLLPPVRPTIPCEAVMDLNGLSLSLTFPCRSRLLTLGNLSHFVTPLRSFAFCASLSNTARASSGILDGRGRDENDIGSAR